MSPFDCCQLPRLHVERGASGAARRNIERLRGFEPRVAGQLEREIGARA